MQELVHQMPETPNRPSFRDLPKSQSVVDQLRQEITVAVDGRLPAPDDPFLDNLTLGDYLDLPDTDRTRLWENWTAEEAVSSEESDVHTGARPAE